MTSSKAASMLLFLLLVVLVFPHMDQALGEQMQIRKLKETYHLDHLTTVHRRVLRGFVGKFLKGLWCGKRCDKSQDLSNLIPPPSPPPSPKFRFPPPPRRFP